MKPNQISWQNAKEYKETKNELEMLICDCGNNLFHKQNRKIVCICCGKEFIKLKK